MPPTVYWIRRLLLLIVLLVIVGLVWWWLRDDDANVKRSGSGQPPPTESSTSAPTKTVKSSTQTTTQAPPSEKGRSCDKSDIELSVVTDRPTYPDGQEPRFTLTVENVSDKACVHDVGAPALELSVSSGGQTVWSSDDCSPGGDRNEMALKPGQRYEQSVQWARIPSSEGCPTQSQPSAPGEYQVYFRNLNQFSDPAVFVLE